MALTRSIELPDRRLLRGAAIGIASGLTAGVLYAATTPSIPLAGGALVGILAGAIAGLLHASLDKLIK